MSSQADYLICGAGIVGTTIALELLKQGAENIVIIEKEEAPGRHASGRNSGVLHAGIYYSADTLKAKFCLRGNRLMKQYCLEKGLLLQENGKVIVTRGEDEIPVLKELYQRARENGARVELIDEQQLEELEPFAKTHRMALWSHDTAVVDPKAVVTSLCNDLISSGRVTILYSTAFLGCRGNNIAITSRGELGYRMFINAAGAYSDRVAHWFGTGRQYRLVPFKGIYRRLKEDKSFLVKGNIYPVPDIRNPFLGVHFTRDVHGTVSIGPTAIPALGRENYGIFAGIDSEAIGILLREAVLFAVNPKFREVACTEPKKYRFSHFYEDARKLMKKLEPDDIIPFEKVGIRPQLIDWEKKELVMDFLVLREANSLHILNAISPAFTGSLSFAEFVVKDYISPQNQ